MRTGLAVSGLLLAAVVAGCSSPGAAPATSAAASASSPSAAASSAAPTAGGATTVEAKEVGSLGTVLVAASNGMTVYIFTMDTKDSGTSACTGNCIKNWPALTVPAGQTPTAGTGVTGTLATITRPDDGTLQVTYNGLPLYFFINDKAPGDSNGVYENWEAVKP
jgi:predicted lipoprotein with Yx(FWY)xxD motif